jgi:hypothetical protein
VANLVVTVPQPTPNLTAAFTAGVWQVQFLSNTNWLYTLERTRDLQTWSSISVATNGNGTTLILEDLNPPADRAFYRVRFDRPAGGGSDE